MIFAIDFDGTLAEHRFPDIGQEVPGAFSTLKKLQEAGHKLILWTMRSDLHAPESIGPEGKPADQAFLANAVEWCKQRGIEFWGINENPDQNWTASPKAYANHYIDDMAVGCPLMPASESDRPMVDWEKVEEQLIAVGAIQDAATTA